MILLVIPGDKYIQIAPGLIAIPGLQDICTFVGMEKNINPNEEKPVRKEGEVKEEPVIHDGSGGAFEGTEMVTEEREDKPRPKGPTPY